VEARLRVRCAPQAHEEVPALTVHGGKGTHPGRQQEADFREDRGREGVRGGLVLAAGEGLREARGAFEGEHPCSEEGQATAVVVEEEQLDHQTFISTRISFRPMKT
jgi:hypothetical protein